MQIAIRDSQNSRLATEFRKELEFAGFAGERTYVR